MSHTVVLDLPEETLLRYRKGAEAARKPLEEFLVDRLKEAAPPYGLTATVPTEVALEQFNQLSDEALWRIAQQRLTDDQQKEYSRLLNKNQAGALLASEEKVLAELGKFARQLTMDKAQAFMILKWRGHELPNPNELQDEE